jgi:hypothetical protein
VIATVSVKKRYKACGGIPRRRGNQSGYHPEIMVDEWFFSRNYDWQDGRASNSMFYQQEEKRYDQKFLDSCAEESQVSIDSRYRVYFL